jgi:hypothetical protein
MLETLNAGLEHWYPLGWSIIFLIEMLLGILTLGILVVEYKYDKAYNETRKRKRRVSKSKVKVIIDADGNARISEAPKDVDVSIEHEGKDS